MKRFLVYVTNFPAQTVAADAFFIAEGGVLVFTTKGRHIAAYTDFYKVVMQ